MIGVKFDPVKVGAALRPPLSDYLRAPQGRALEGRRRAGRACSRSLSGIDLDARTTALPPHARGRPRRRRALGGARVPRHAARADDRGGARARRDARRRRRRRRASATSSANRVFNVALLAKLLDGTIVKPGATFSFNETVGKRTAERGFREGQAIENGVLVPSIGGGVCQAATTVFDAAFAAATSISHRVNHSFYISHYPLGLDATVADTGPDFTFVNDTKNAIVIKATREPRDDDRRLPLAPARPARREGARPRRRPSSSPRSATTRAPTSPAGTVSQTTLGEQRLPGHGLAHRERRRRQGAARRQLPLPLHPRGRDLPDRQGRQAAGRPDARRPLPGLHRLDGRHRPRDAGSRSRPRRSRPPTAPRAGRHVPRRRPARTADDRHGRTTTGTDGDDGTTPDGATTTPDGTTTTPPAG